MLGCPVDLLLHKYAEGTGRKGLGIADDHDKSPPINARTSWQEVLAVIIGEKASNWLMACTTTQI